jgi:hypothetical protein
MKNIATVFLMLIIFGCSNEKNELVNQEINNEELRKNEIISEISTFIIDLGEEQTMGQKNNNNVTTSFSSCATVSVNYSNTTWTRTVDFGTTGCQYLNGPVLKGKIIYSGTIDFNFNNYNVNYVFEDFYYDDIKVDGNKTLSKHIGTSDLSNSNHPISTLDIDLEVTFQDNQVYSRTGNTTKEFVEGYTTIFNVNDNKFLTTGNWITSNSSGVTSTSTITSPLEKRGICPYFRSGIIDLNYAGDLYNVNYGNGDCDNIALVSHNGGTPVEIHF